MKRLTLEEKLMARDKIDGERITILRRIDMDNARLHELIVERQHLMMED